MLYVVKHMNIYVTIHALFVLYHMLLLPVNIILILDVANTNHLLTLIKNETLYQDQRTLEVLIHEKMGYQFDYVNIPPTSIEDIDRGGIKSRYDPIP